MYKKWVGYKDLCNNKAVKGARKKYWGSKKSNYAISCANDPHNLRSKVVQMTLTIWEAKLYLSLFKRNFIKRHWRRSPSLTVALYEGQWPASRCGSFIPRHPLNKRLGDLQNPSGLWRQNPKPHPGNESLSRKLTHLLRITAYTVYGRYCFESLKGHRLPSPKFSVVFLSYCREIRKLVLGSTLLSLHHSLVTLPFDAI